METDIFVLVQVGIDAANEFFYGECEVLFAPKIHSLQFVIFIVFFTNLFSCHTLTRPHQIPEAEEDINPFLIAYLIQAQQSLLH